MLNLVLDSHWLWSSGGERDVTVRDTHGIFP